MRRSSFVLLILVLPGLAFADDEMSGDERCEDASDATGCSDYQTPQPFSCGLVCDMAYVEMMIANLRMTRTSSLNALIASPPREFYLLTPQQREYMSHSFAPRPGLAVGGVFVNMVIPGLGSLIQGDKAQGAVIMSTFFLSAGLFGLGMGLGVLTEFRAFESAELVAMTVVTGIAAVGMYFVGLVRPLVYLSVQRKRVDLVNFLLENSSGGAPEPTLITPYLALGFSSNRFQPDVARKPVVRGGLTLGF